MSLLTHLQAAPSVPRWTLYNCTVCSDRYIHFKAAPFNIVRPDVNISFMWAKHNPVRELAGGRFRGREAKGEEVLVKVTFPMKLPYKWYLFGTWLNSSFHSFSFSLLCGSCYVLLSRLAVLVDSRVETCDGCSAVECCLTCSITEGEIIHCYMPKLICKTFHVRI